VRYPNVYGIDMPTAAELIGHNRDEEEIARAIGADWLVYQDLDDLVAAVRQGNPAIERFDTSVFDGHYVTGDVTPEYLARLEARRNDAAKAKQGDDQDEALDLHNTDAGR